MKGTVLTAFLIVFVDVMKELPATLILRPIQLQHARGQSLRTRS